MCLTDGVLQAYSDQELASGARAEVAAHLAACDRCRERAEVVAQRRHRVTVLLDAMTPDEAPVAAAPALARFHARAAEASRTPVLGFAFVLKATFAAAVVGLAAFAIATAWRPAPGAHTPGRQAASVAQPQPAPPEPTPAVAQAEPTTPTAVAEPVNVPRPVPSRRRAMPVAASEPYLLLSDDVSRPEMGMVVRVRVPLSALTTIGDLPSNLRTSPEIEADVLVGQDGRARAIRFVSQTLTPGRK